MRQEPHQCIFSFVCASNTNMIMTRKMLKSLSKKFGYKVIFDGKEFYTFPSVSSLNKASINELQSFRFLQICNLKGGKKSNNDWVVVP